jgi:hypothetical protein
MELAFCSAEAPAAGLTLPERLPPCYALAFTALRHPKMSGIGISQLCRPTVKLDRLWPVLANLSN